MIGYCIPCAKTIGVQSALDALPVDGTCCMCTAPAPVMNEQGYGEGRERLNPAALRMKLQRGEALPRT